MYGSWRVGTPVERIVRRNVSLVRVMPFRTTALLLLSCCSGTLAGCAHWGADPVLYAVTLQASCRAGARPYLVYDRQRDYWQGWRAGYLDVSSGGVGARPAVPPPRYWKTSGRPWRRQNRVDEWYGGFADGASEAAACGWKDAYVIPGPSDSCVDTDANEMEPDVPEVYLQPGTTPGRDSSLPATDRLEELPPEPRAWRNCRQGPGKSTNWNRGKSGCRRPGDRDPTHGSSRLPGPRRLVRPRPRW